MKTLIKVLIIVAVLVWSWIVGVLIASAQPAQPCTDGCKGITTPIPTPMVRHQTYELWSRSGNDHRTDRRMSDEEADDLTCSAMWPENNTSQPDNVEWIGRMAPVVNLRGVWYVSITVTGGSSEAQYPLVLSCSGGVQSWSPLWIEDREPGLIGSGDRLTLSSVAVTTIYLERNVNVVYAACGYVPNGVEWLCLRLDVFRVAIQFVPYAPLRHVMAVNYPLWASTLATYPIEGCYE